MSKYNPASKKFQEDARKLGLSGYQYYRKLVEEGKLPNPTDIGIVSRDESLRKRGFDNYNKYRQDMRHDKGIQQPMSENKFCSSYLGVFIGEKTAEKILIDIFGSIEKRMPYGYPWYEYVVNGGYKVDVKSSGLYEGRTENANKWWLFHIRYNRFVDYFLLIGFENRDNKDPVRIWLIKKDEIIRDSEFWKRESFTITDHLRYLLPLRKYEYLKL